MSEKVLIIGSGGREHAIACKLAASPRVGQLFAAPGNSGTARLAKTQNVVLNVADHEEIAGWCVDNAINLVVVGPEDPLAEGISDRLAEAGVPCFGPVRLAARIEASKDFAKTFMSRHSIATARFRSFDCPLAAKEHIRSADYQALVVKASGLAAGKGVVVAADVDEACRAVDELSALPAGRTIVVEELLRGEEVSVLAFCDGTNAAVMPPAQDHKRLLDGDRGPNTGGMGAYCPSSLLSKEELERVGRDTIQKVLDGLRAEGIQYKGVLYAGLMITEDGAKVLEYNCRLGDPETQVILPLLESDLYDVMKACVDGDLASVQPLRWTENSVAVGVVVCSGGYPGPCQKGLPITGVEDVVDVQILHAGVSLKDDRLVTSGGRVLCAVAVASDALRAAAAAQRAAASISFDGAHRRTDIAYRQVARDVLARGSTSGGLTYAGAGVSIDTAARLIDKIGAEVDRTRRAGSVGGIGGFGGLFDLKAAGYGDDALLVSGTDGVGTKVKVAQAVGRHSTLGIDLVAMCVNDVLAEGAEPLFFLDYLACGRLDVSVAAQLVAGVADGCRTAGCALTGGETAEMPGVYAPGDYDVAGFCVGAVARDRLLPRKDLMADGDLLVGLASSGIHSNGISLARAVVERAGLDLNSPAPFDPQRTIGEVLLTPTRIYVRPMLALLRTGRVKAVAHITGGGLCENVPRVLPDHLVAQLDASRWTVPQLFAWMATAGQVSCDEMLRTFNCGLGLVLVVDAATDVAELLADLPVEWAPAVVGRLRTRGSAHQPSVSVTNLERQMLPAMHPFVHRLMQRAVDRKRVAVLISGSGTNLQALIDASGTGAASSYRIVLVLSNVAGVAGLERAAAAGIETVALDHRRYAKRLDFDMAVHEALQRHRVQLVCLAGFMRILTPELTRLWRGRMLNVHPALLPAFKGIHAQRQALQAGVRITGCTVHFVEADVDAGAIVMQEAVPLMAGDTEDALTERIKKAEHRVYPSALHAVASGRIRLGADGRIES